MPEANNIGDTVITVGVYDGRGGMDTQTYTLYILHPVGIGPGANYLPQKFVLDKNYPNPFNPTTIIKYQIPEISFVTIKVYDVLGNEVVTLINEEKPVGNYEVEFDAVGLSSGMYFFTLQAGSFIETKKMVLMK